MLGPGIDWPPPVSRTGGLPRLWRPTDEHEEHHITEPRINERIRVPEVRLVGPNGEQVGIVRVEDALRLAQEADLDLVEVAPEARPPVCKLMDFGKFKYEADMKAREARRNQANTVLKEIRFRLKIDPHDYGTKKGHVERFLKAGDKVKVMIMFRGREQSRPEMGLRLLRRLSDDVVDTGFIESAPKQDGRNMIMVLGPVKKKAEAKSEQRRRAQETVTTKSPTAAPAVAQATDAPVSVGVEAPVVEARRRWLRRRWLRRRWLRRRWLRPRWLRPRWRPHRKQRQRRPVRPAPPCPSPWRLDRHPRRPPRPRRRQPDARRSSRHPRRPPLMTLPRRHRPSRRRPPPRQHRSPARPRPHQPRTPEQY